MLTTSVAVVRKIDEAVAGSAPSRFKRRGQREEAADQLLHDQAHPGGYIPSLAETLILMEEYDLCVSEVENRSYHYHRTVDE